MRFGKTKSRQSEGRQYAIGGVVLVLMVGAFFFSYMTGVGSQKEEGLKRITDLTHKNDFVRGKLNKCRETRHNLMQQRGEGKGEMKKLEDENERLETQNNELAKQDDDLSKKVLECQENQAFLQQQWSDDDRKHAKIASDLAEKNQRLIEESRRLSSTTGMRMVLLQASLSRLLEENKRLRFKLGQAIEPNTTLMVENLVEKWRKKDQTEGEGRGMLSAHSGKVLDSDRSEFSEVLPDAVEPFKFSREAEEAKRIFTHRRDEEGNYNRPRWRGRIGTQPLKYGVYINQSYAATSDVVRSLRVLYEYALCAMGNNNTKFTYPTNFRAKPGSEVQKLHEYIDTPLVHFCDDCRPQHYTGEFRLFCQGFTSEEQYGSFLFWKMRSRIHFHPKYYMAADHWLEQHMVNPETSLAVRIVGSFAKNCERWLKHGRAQLSYLRLLKGSSKELTTTAEEQCNPPIETVIKLINKFVEEKQYTDVYISSENTPQEELSSGITNARVHFTTRTPGKETEDTIMDIIIASKMKGLIANRFDLLSTHMIEYYLLNHDFKKSRIAVW